MSNLRNDNVNGNSDERATEVSTLPLLIAVGTVAEMLGVSINTVWTMDATGKIPSPIRLGRRCTRWRRIEIEAWVRAGCPLRNQWEANRV
jgi:prophage regulatory protein